MSTAEKSDRPERNQDLRCQSGPSAKDSVIFSGGDFSKNYGADQQRLQISDLHFDKFPTPATFACWKIRFKTEVCACSEFPTEAVQWIKEVELVDSVDEREREMRREAEVPEESPSGSMSRWPCKDYLKGTCTNSFCEKWHPPECLFYKTKSGCRYGGKCSYAHRQVDEQPTTRSSQNGDKSAVAMLKKNELHDRTGQLVVKRVTLVMS